MEICTQYRDGLRIKRNYFQRKLHQKDNQVWLIPYVHRKHTLGTTNFLSFAQQKKQYNGLGDQPKPKLTQNQELNFKKKNLLRYRRLTCEIITRWGKFTWYLQNRRLYAPMKNYSKYKLLVCKPNALGPKNFTPLNVYWLQNTLATWGLTSPKMNSIIMHNKRGLCEKKKSVSTEWTIKWFFSLTQQTHMADTD